MLNGIDLSGISKSNVGVSSLDKESLHINEINLT